MVLGSPVLNPKVWDLENINSKRSLLPSVGDDLEFVCGFGLSVGLSSA